MKTKFLSILTIGVALFVGACNEDNESSKGKISVSITDAPIDDANVEAVYISINSVEVNGPDGWVTLDEFDEPEKIDLLSYQDGNAYFLTEETINTGTYTEVRLILDIQERNGNVQANPGCYIEYKDGSVQPLFVPSGGQSGYKAKGEFTIADGGVTAVTLDFDVRKAVVEAGNSGKFILKPTVRLVEDADVAMIRGTFDDEDADYTSVVVFAYENGTFTEAEIAAPADEDVRFPNAVTSDAVEADGSFTLAFMNAGTYDLYFAAFDENGDFVELIGTSPDVTLSAGLITELELTLTLLD